VSSEVSESLESCLNGSLQVGASPGFESVSTGSSKVSGARPVGLRLSPGECRELFIRKAGRKNGVDLERLCEQAGIDLPFGGVFPANPDQYIIDLWSYRIDKNNSEVIVLQDDGSEDCIFISPVMRGTDAYYNKTCRNAETLNKWVLGSGLEKLVLLSFSIRNYHSDSILGQFITLTRLVHNAVQRMEKSRYPRGHRRAGQPRHFGHKIRRYWVAEVHASGFIHLHMLVFEPEIPHWRELVKWWGESGYANASGLDYKVIPVRQYKRLRNGDVEVNYSIINYITKYVGKSFPRLDAADSPLGDTARWWAAFLWFSNKRTWGSSRDISRIMRGVQDDSEGVEVGSNGAESDAPRACNVSRSFIYLGTMNVADFDVVRDVFGGDFADYFQTHRFARFKPPPYEPRVKGAPLMRRLQGSVRWGYN